MKQQTKTQAMPIITIYENKETKELHEVTGIKNLAQAWRLVDYVANRRGWNSCDVTVISSVNIYD